jgi:hypothetical protein
VQVGELERVAGEERAALALLGRGLAVVPHVVVHEQLPAALEHVDQGHRPLCTDQRDLPIHLDHRQPPARGRDRVALPGMGLLAYQQLVELGLPGCPVDDLGHRVRRAVRVHRFTSQSVPAGFRRAFGG